MKKRWSGDGGLTSFASELLSHGESSRADEITVKGRGSVDSSGAARDQIEKSISTQSSERSMPRLRTHNEETKSAERGGRAWSTRARGKANADRCDTYRIEYPCEKKVQRMISDN